jgi:hypothetical protein
VSRYLALHNPNMTAFDMDGDGALSTDELAGALLHMDLVSNATVGSAPSAAALRDYASATCFLRHEGEADGRSFATATDLRTSDGPLVDGLDRAAAALRLRGHFPCCAMTRVLELRAPTRRLGDGVASVAFPLCSTGAGSGDRDERVTAS